jgi:hypothetical protein
MMHLVIHRKPVASMRDSVLATCGHFVVIAVANNMYSRTRKLEIFIKVFQTGFFLGICLLRGSRS